MATECCCWCWCWCWCVTLTPLPTPLPVCTFKTSPPACGNTCGRGAGTHGDVLNVHTVAFYNVHTGREVRVRGVRDTPTPTPTPTHCTPTTHNAQRTQRTTHNTAHARCHRQFCLAKFAHGRLSLDPRGTPKKPLDLTFSV